MGSSPASPWTLYHKAEVPNWTVTYPGQNHPFSDDPDYIEVRVSKPALTAVLSAHSRRGASGNEMTVSPAMLGKVTDGTSVTLSPATSGRYLYYRLTHDLTKLVAFAGLLLALVATVLAGFTSASSSDGLSALHSVYVVLQVVGLVVGFVGVLLQP
jgi:hypothetical protein